MVARDIEVIVKMDREFLAANDTKRRAEIAVALELCGYGASAAGTGILIASIVERYEEKCLLLSVIHLGNPHGPAKRTAEFVEMDRRLSSAKQIVLEQVGIEEIVLIKLVQTSVVILGAALRFHVDG